MCDRYYTHVSFRMLHITCVSGRVYPFSSEIYNVYVHICICAAAETTLYEPYTCVSCYMCFMPHVFLLHVSHATVFHATYVSHAICVSCYMCFMLHMCLMLYVFHATYVFVWIVGYCGPSILPC